MAIEAMLYQNLIAFILSIKSLPYIYHHIPLIFYSYLMSPVLAY
jgi:hypothetical protein